MTFSLAHDLRLDEESGIRVIIGRFERVSQVVSATEDARREARV
jgi:hypothetical protein